MKKRNGFTLIELLAVIVVLGIILVITIATVTKTLRGAQKDAFFIYAQNIQSKAIAQYTQDLEHNVKNTECAVYDIDKDLNLSDTGKYEGWVKVLREPINSGKKALNIPITNSNGLLYVRYCVSKSNCTPTESVYLAENTKSTTVSKVLSEGERLCIQYDYPDLATNTVKKSSVNCYDYNDGTTYNDSFKYSVVISLKDDNYAVEDVVFNDDMSSDKFNKKIEEFKEAHKDNPDKLVISSPVCSESESVTYKGETTSKTTIISTSTNTQPNSIVIGTSTTSTNSVIITTSEPNITNTTVVTTNENQTTTKGVTVVTTTTSATSTTLTTSRTTTVNTNDSSLLLQSLNVSGYSEYVKFSPYQFNYTLNVPNSITSLNVTAIPRESSSVVEIHGNENLQVGNNPISIVVRNPITNKEATYRIEVRRLGIGGQIITNPVEPTTKPPVVEEGLPDPTIDSSNASLQNILISGYQLNFDPNNYEYTIITNGEKQLFIDYQPQVKESLVSMNGNNNLENDSIITISVQSQNGYYHKDYKIQVKVAKKDSKTKYILRAIIVVLVLILAIIIAVLSKKKKK